MINRHFLRWLLAASTLAFANVANAGFFDSLKEELQKNVGDISEKVKDVVKDPTQIIQGEKVESDTDSANDDSIEPVAEPSQATKVEETPSHHPPNNPSKAAKLTQKQKAFTMNGENSRIRYQLKEPPNGVDLLPMLLPYYDGKLMLGSGLLNLLMVYQGNELKQAGLKWQNDYSDQMAYYVLRDFKALLPYIDKEKMKNGWLANQKSYGEMTEDERLHRTANRLFKSIGQHLLPANRCMGGNGSNENRKTVCQSFFNALHAPDGNLFKARRNFSEYIDSEFENFVAYADSIDFEEPFLNVDKMAPEQRPVYLFSENAYQFQYSISNVAQRLEERFDTGSFKTKNPLSYLVNPKASHQILLPATAAQAETWEPKISEGAALVLEIKPTLKEMTAAELETAIIRGEPQIYNVELGSNKLHLIDLELQSSDNAHYSVEVLGSYSLQTGEILNAASKKNDSSETKKATVTATKPASNKSTPSIQKSNYPESIIVYESPNPELFKSIVFPALDGKPVLLKNYQYFAKWKNSLTPKNNESMWGLSTKNALFEADAREMFWRLQVLKTVHPLIDVEEFVNFRSSLGDVSALKEASHAKASLYHHYANMLQYLVGKTMRPDECKRYLSESYKQRGRTKVDECLVFYVTRDDNVFEVKRTMTAFFENVMPLYLSWSESLPDSFEYLEFSSSPRIHYDFTKSAFVVAQGSLGGRSYSFQLLESAASPTAKSNLWKNLLFKIPPSEAEDISVRLEGQHSFTRRHYVMNFGNPSPEEYLLERGEIKHLFPVDFASNSVDIMVFTDAGYENPHPKNLKVAFKIPVSKLNELPY